MHGKAGLGWPAGFNLIIYLQEQSKTTIYVMHVCVLKKKNVILDLMEYSPIYIYIYIYI